jgi:hypothetical protein
VIHDYRILIFDFAMQRLLFLLLCGLCLPVAAQTSAKKRTAPSAPVSATQSSSLLKVNVTAQP